MKSVIMSMLCKKLSCAYITFDKDFTILSLSENSKAVADDIETMKVGNKIYDCFWEFIGLNKELEQLYNNDTTFFMPMICKKETYYNLDIDTLKIKGHKKCFIALFITQKQFSKNYSRMIKNVNLRSLNLETKEEEMQKSEQYRSLFNQQLISFHVNPDGIINNTNAACLVFFGLNDNDMRGQHFSHFFNSTGIVQLETVEGDSQILTAIKHDGGVVYFNAAIMPVYKETKLQECVIICQDITHLKQTQKQLEHAVNHDHLTHLPNRNLLFTKIEQAIAFAQENMTAFALCFIDVDYFKQVNDKYGHQAGDLVLIHLGKLLSKTTRANDTVARIGGDEFVILINNIENAKQLAIAIERLENASTIKPLVYNNEVINYQFSLGLARYPHDGTDATNLLSYADKAMYKVKKTHHQKN